MVATGASGFCGCSKYVHAKRVPQEEHPKNAHYTYMSYYNTRYSMLLKIVPDSLTCLHCTLAFLLTGHRLEMPVQSFVGAWKPRTPGLKVWRTSSLRGSPLAFWGHTACKMNKSIQECILAHQYPEHA